MNSDFTIATHSDRSLRSGATRSPFGYYGAKLRIARTIVADLPPHNAWVEAFCGSAALTLAKSPAPIEVINDADGQIVNVFRQLRDAPDELCRAVALTPYSRAEFESSHHGDECINPLEEARRFLVRTMMTVNAAVAGGTSGFSFSQSYSRGGREARVNRWYNLPERLAAVVERLRGIRVENRDARELVDMFSDRPATLMYLDPPYFVRREHGYAVDANELDFHVELLERCKRAKCMLLLSAYDTEIYRELLSEKDGWTSHSIETSTRDTTGQEFERTEVLWMNAQFLKAKRTGRVPIRLSRQERRDRKLNPPRHH